MATAIINSQMDAINESFSNISSDLTTIRPLLKNASIGAYPTDTASGSIASFIDGADGIPVKSLSVDLEPVQDLNGYDNPWPAGGGKNKANPTTFSITRGTVMEFSPSLPSGTYAFSYMATRTGSDSRNASMRVVYDDDSYLDLTINVKTGSRRNEVFNATKSVKSVYFYSISANWVDSGNFTLTCTDFQIESGSTATAYAPYSNICPISGHTEVNVTRTGKNLWHTDFTNSGGGLTKRDGEMEVDVSLATSTTYLLGGRSSNFIGYKLKSGTYTLSAHSTDFSGIYVTLSDGSTWANGETKTFLSDVIINNVCCAKKELSVGTYTLHWQLQIELGSTATDYEPYAGQTYNTPLGRTVYGGTLNVTTGELKITHTLVDGGNISWTYWYGTYFYGPIADKTADSATDIKCEIYPTTNGAVGTNGIFNTSSPKFAYICDTSLSHDAAGAAALKAKLTGHKIWYRLETPPAVQLTPSQVSTLLGANNIWADAGEVSVLYRADVGLYIDKRLAQALSAV